jgi:hypothetical protein
LRQTDDGRLLSARDSSITPMLKAMNYLDKCLRGFRLFRIDMILARKYAQNEAVC